MAGDTGVDEGIGLTALMVAAARAIETHRHDALARDVYAEHFVRGLVDLAEEGVVSPGELGKAGEMGSRPSLGRPEAGVFDHFPEPLPIHGPQPLTCRSAPRPAF